MLKPRPPPPYLMRSRLLTQTCRHHSSTPERLAQHHPGDPGGPTGDHTLTHTNHRPRSSTSDSSFLTHKGFPLTIYQ